MDDPPARGPRPVSTLGGLVVALGNKIGGGAVRAVIFAGTVGIVLVAVSLAFLALFIVHQLSLWLSVDPERAFSGAKTMVGVYATTWDTTANVYNSFADVVVAALPAYNAAVYYGVQPSVFTALDVLSLAFLQRPYGGIISEEQIPFEGYSCPPDGSLDKSAQWCGLLSFYSKSLGIAAGSTDSFVANSSIVLSTRTARRLSFAIGEPVIGVLDLEVLVDAIQAIVSSFVVLSGTLSDIIFHVAFTVLSEVFELLFSLFMLIVKSLASAVMMVIRSGVLQTVIKIGMDLLIVLVTEVALPLLMAVIDVVTCLLDLTQVAGWTQQLLCSAPRRCRLVKEDAHTVLALRS
jgi:hypothetical protein